MSDQPRTPAQTLPTPSPRPARRVTELTTSKVLAGGMAAATSAVLGSQFGAFGTVGGAAVGSVITTLGANIYERSLYRAQDRVTAKLPLPGRSPAVTRTPAQASSEPSCESSSSRRPHRRRTPPALLAAVLIFGVGLGAVTGLEWAKGSPLSGGSASTSIGEVFTPKPEPAPAEDTPSEQDSDSDRSDHDTGDSDRSSDRDRNGGRRFEQAPRLLPGEGDRPTPSTTSSPPSLAPPPLPGLSRSGGSSEGLLPLDTGR